MSAPPVPIPSQARSHTTTEETSATPLFVSPSSSLSSSSTVSTPVGSPVWKRVSEQSEKSKKRMSANITFSPRSSFSFDQPPVNTPNKDNNTSNSSNDNGSNNSTNNDNNNSLQSQSTDITSSNNNTTSDNNNNETTNIDDNNNQTVATKNRARTESLIAPPRPIRLSLELQPLSTSPPPISLPLSSTSATSSPSPLSPRASLGYTLEELVKQLTSANSDLTFRFQFFFCYRSFTTSQRLLELLIQAYNESNETVDSAGANTATATSEVGKFVIIRIVGVLGYWLDNYWNADFHENPTLLATLYEFIQTSIASTQSKAAQLLLSKMNKFQLQKEETSSVIPSGVEQPEPMLEIFNESTRKSTAVPKSGQLASSQPRRLTASHWRLMDVYPEELARQLTIIEYDIFKNIQPWEFFDLSWTKEHKEIRSNNILAMIRRFNTVSFMVANEILSKPIPKQRAAVIMRFIKVAEILYHQYHNFNGTMAICASLSSNPIWRLKQSWAHVSEKFLSVFTKFTKLTEKNFSGLRQAIKEASAPCIPYLGIYLSDLLFIEEGNKSSLGDGKINFSKYKKIADVYQQIKQCQQTPYILQTVQFIQDYLQKTPALLNEEQLYKWSLLVEPREQSGESPETSMKNQNILGNEHFIESQYGLSSSSSQSSTYSYQITEDEMNFLEKTLYNQNLPTEKYLFSIPDIDANFRAADSDSDDCPIAYATVAKLVEKLTNYRYFFPEYDKIHSKIKCAVCGDLPIVGIRYRCINCKFDVCQHCAESSRTHDPSHMLLKLTFKPDTRIPHNIPVVQLSDVVPNQQVACHMCGELIGSDGAAVRYSCVTCQLEICASCEKFSSYYHDRTHSFLRVSFPWHALKILTLPKMPSLTEAVDIDILLTDAFLLTFRLYWTPDKLFELLLARFNVSQVTSDSTSDIFQKYVKFIVEPIHLRVLSFCLRWYEKYYQYDFLRNSALDMNLVQFVNSVAQGSNSAPNQTPKTQSFARIVLAKVESIFVRYQPLRDKQQQVQQQQQQQQQWQQTNDSLLFPSMLNTHKPLSTYQAAVQAIAASQLQPDLFLENSSQSISGNVPLRISVPPMILTLDAQTIAEQLVVMEMEIIEKIHPLDFITKLELVSDSIKNVASFWKAQTMSSPLDALLELSTKVRDWVITEILKHAELESQLKALAVFLEISEILKQMNAFDVLKAVLSGLQSDPVVCLLSWNHMASKYLDSFDKLSQFFSPLDDYKNYRTCLAQCKQFCIPYIGLVIDDLLYVNTLNGNTIESDNNLINFTKFF